MSDKLIMSVKGSKVKVEELTGLLHDLMRSHSIETSCMKIEKFPAPAGRMDVNYEFDETMAHEELVDLIYEMEDEFELEVHMV